VMLGVYDPSLPDLVNKSKSPWEETGEQPLIQSKFCRKKKECTEVLPERVANTLGGEDRRRGKGIHHN